MEGNRINEVKYLDEIHSSINTYSLHAIHARPRKLITDQFASSYAVNDYFCNVISSWDIEDRESYFAKELYVFDFKIRTLCTPFQHKYNDLFRIEKQSRFCELVEGLEEDDIEIKYRHDFPSETLFDLYVDDAPRIKIRGHTGFWEEKIE